MPLLGGRIRANVAHFAAGEPLEGAGRPRGRLLSRRPGERWRAGLPSLRPGLRLGGPAVAVRLRRPVRPAGTGRADPLVRADSVVAVALPVGPARRWIMGKGQPGRGYDPAGPGSAGAVVQARVRLADPVVQGPGGGGDDQRSCRSGGAAGGGRQQRKRRSGGGGLRRRGPGWQPRCSFPRHTPPARVAAIEVFGARVVHGARRSGPQPRPPPGRRWNGPGPGMPATSTGPPSCTASRPWPSSCGNSWAGRPGRVVVPAGNGTLVLGLWLGFRELAAGGHVAPPARDRRRAGRTLRPPGRPAARRTDGRHRHRHRPSASGPARPGRPSWPAGARSSPSPRRSWSRPAATWPAWACAVEPTAAAAWAAALPAVGTEQATVVVLSGAAD